MERTYHIPQNLRDIDDETLIEMGRVLAEIAVAGGEGANLCGLLSEALASENEARKADHLSPELGFNLTDFTDTELRGGIGRFVAVCSHLEAEGLLRPLDVARQVLNGIVEASTTELQRRRDVLSDALS